MNLTKLNLSDNIYQSPKKNFNHRKVNNLENISKSLNFAQQMTFGEGDNAFHRKYRTGGIEVRNVYQLFENTFQGKLAEFILYEYFKFYNIPCSEPDLQTFGKGEWDSGDLEVNNFSLNVKSMKHFSSLLLLEQKDWSLDGAYLPNDQRYDYFFIVRVNIPFREIKNYKDLKVEDLENKIYFDLPGFITHHMLCLAIQNKHIIKQGLYLNSIKTKMDADNYYIHANDFMPIEEFAKLIKK